MENSRISRGFLFFTKMTGRFKKIETILIPHPSIGQRFLKGGVAMDTYELKQLMRAHGDYLVKLSYIYVKSWSTAEEIVQDVFVKFFETQEQFEERASIKTYLAKMTINKSHDHLRSVSGRLKILRQMWQTANKTQPSIEQETLERLAKNQIADAVLQLPLKYREVIALYYYEEYTSREIAELLDVSENTVKTRLRRGRTLLRPKLKDFQGEVKLDD